MTEVAISQAMLGARMWDGLTLLQQEEAYILMPAESLTAMHGEKTSAG